MDEPPRRIRLPSILTAFAAAAAFSWTGYAAHRSRDLVVQTRVPLSPAYEILMAAPLWLWCTAALALGVVLCLKDLWFEENRARFIDTLTVPLLFLLYVLVDRVAQAPLWTLLEGMGRRGPR